MALTKHSVFQVESFCEELYSVDLAGPSWVPNGIYNASAAEMSHKRQKKKK